MLNQINIITEAYMIYVIDMFVQLRKVRKMHSKDCNRKHSKDIVPSC